MKLDYIKPLDGVRTFAILSVIIWHFFNCITSDKLFGGMMEYLKLPFFMTWSGVDLFFVLSGFLIGRILIFNKGSQNYFKTFYARRVFRIFPAYYLIIFLFVLFSAVVGADKAPWLTSKPFPLYSYLLYIQNFWGVSEGFGAKWLSVAWSLAIEEQFYIILPFILYILPKKKIPLVVIVLIFVAPIVRFLLPTTMGAYVLLPARMDALLMGVLIAYYHLNGTIDKLFKDRTTVLYAAIFLLLLILFFVKAVLREGIGGVFIHSVLALIYGTFIVLILVLDHKNPLIKLLSTSSAAFIARISYMIYLTHQIFNGLLHQFVLSNDVPRIASLEELGITVIALVATVLFSVLSYNYFESPILKLGKKYMY